MEVEASRMRHERITGMSFSPSKLTSGQLAPLLPRLQRIRLRPVGVVKWGAVSPGLHRSGSDLIPFLTIRPFATVERSNGKSGSRELSTGGFPRIGSVENRN